MMTNTEIAAQAYKEAALWTEELLVTEGFDFTEWDFTREASDAIETEVSRFITAAADVIDDDENYAQLGHDLWLTRNGHGAGFWDRGTGAKGERLTELAKIQGEASIWIVGKRVMYESKTTIARRLEGKETA